MENKGLNIVLIVILTILAVSLLSIMILCILNKNFKVSLFAIGDKTEKIFESEHSINDVNSIDIKAYSSNVKFVEGESDKIKVTIYGFEDEKFNVNLEDGKLKIAKDNKTFQVFVFMAWARQEVIVELPSGFEGELRNRNFKWKYRSF